MKQLLHLLSLAWRLWWKPEPQEFVAPLVGGPFDGVETLLWREPPDGEVIEMETERAIYFYQFEAVKRRWVFVECAPHLRDAETEKIEGR